MAMSLAIFLVLGVSWLNQGVAEGERKFNPLAPKWDFISNVIHWGPHGANSAAPQEPTKEAEPPAALPPPVLATATQPADAPPPAAPSAGVQAADAPPADEPPADEPPAEEPVLEALPAAEPPADEPVELQPVQPEPLELEPLELEPLELEPLELDPLDDLPLEDEPLAEEPADEEPQQEPPAHEPPAVKPPAAVPPADKPPAAVPPAPPAGKVKPRPETRAVRQLRAIGQQLQLRATGQQQQLRTIGQQLQQRVTGQQQQLRAIGQQLQLRAAGPQQQLRAIGQQLQLGAIGQELLPQTAEGRHALAMAAAAAGTGLALELAARRHAHLVRMRQPTQPPAAIKQPAARKKAEPQQLAAGKEAEPQQPVAGKKAEPQQPAAPQRAEPQQPAAPEQPEPVKQSLVPAPEKSEPKEAEQVAPPADSKPKETAGNATAPQPGPTPKEATGTVAPAPEAKPKVPTSSATGPQPAKSKGSKVSSFLSSLKQPGGVLGVSPKLLNSLLACCGLLLAASVLGVRVRRSLKLRRGRRALVPRIWSDKPSLTSNQMMLVWQMPGGPDVKVDQYDLERVPDGKVVYSGLETSHLEQGLAPSTRLKFRVRATVESIPRDWSSVVTETTPALKPTVPDAPSLWFGSGGASVTSVKVMWSEPAANGHAISAYKLEKRQHGGDWQQVCERKGSVTSYIAEDLQPETGYDFRVAARNAKGWGAWSPECTSRTAMISTLKDQHVRVVVEGTDPLRVRMEVVPDEQLAQENSALQRRADELRNELHQVRNQHG